MSIYIPELSFESDSESEVSEDSEVFSGKCGSCAISIGVSLYSGLLKEKKQPMYTYMISWNRIVPSFFKTLLNASNNRKHRKAFLPSFLTPFWATR